jgi:hypothetical protein
MDDDDIDRDLAAEVAAANAYVVCEHDEWLIDLIARVSRSPGHHVGSVKLSALSAYLNGYFMARIDAGLPADTDLIVNFTRWLLQSGGRPTLEYAMRKLAPDDEVRPFFIAFDEYLRGHGRPEGLRTPSGDRTLPS